MPRRFVLPLLLIPFIVLGCGPTGADENQSSAADIYQPRLYPVVENGRWGFIDSQGEVVVTPRYEWAANFSRDLALVRENGLYGYIRRNADIYQPRLYPVVENGRWGFIDSQGEVVVTPRYEWAANFSRDLALVRENGLYGYIRRNGDVAIEPQYEDAWHFSDGLAPVMIDGQWGYIDAEGVLRVEPQFELNPSVLEEREVDDTDLQPMRDDGRFGFGRADGTVDIETLFDGAWYFSGGLARVQVGDKWGYINRDGDVIIEPRFDRAWDFNDGVAMVEVDSGIGYINRSGDFIWEPTR